MTNIRTPHAAVIVWNYDDRIDSTQTTSIDRVESTIVSTLSLMSISTNKTKSNPQGSFQLVLAPHKNWISTITSGSWCAILMSNDPITKNDLERAHPQKVKMIGKIESVRANVVAQEDGSRQTQYLVTGVDWGHIFNNTIYIDSQIQSENDAKSQGQGVAIAIRNVLFGDDGVPDKFATSQNLRHLFDVFGEGLKGLTQTGADAGRIANAVYDFVIPREMFAYFQFLGPNGPTGAQKLNQLLTLFHGCLKQYDKYDNYQDSQGYIDPFSLQGANTFWQVLLENSNPAINEMFCEIKWETSGPRLSLFNRVKPFAIKGNPPIEGTLEELRSYFQNIKFTDIDPNSVISLNTGTNWRDKYNFIEIKPTFQSFTSFVPWYKQLTQQSDPVAFQREGFRPLIVQTKQFPSGTSETGGLAEGVVHFEKIKGWALALREWYFDTHKMLNGTVTMTGQNGYIAVGENIRFPLDLLNPTPNMNQQTFISQKNKLILAHVESVSHSFTVKPDGTRSFMTTVQFVRGILVNKSNAIVGSGMLDKYAASIGPEGDLNSKNIISTSHKDDPDTRSGA